MDNEIHPFVEKMKNTINEALNPTIPDLYSADQVDEIEEAGGLDSLLNKYLALISLIDKKTNEPYILFVSDPIDLGNKLAQINSTNKYNVIGIDKMK